MGLWVRGNSQCKGLEVGVFLACSVTVEASVAGVEAGEGEEVQGQIVCSGPQYGLWLFKRGEMESHDLTGVFTGSPVPPLL